MKNLLIIVLIASVGAAINLHEPLRNTVDTGIVKGTLDKVKLIGHKSSGRCLIIENGQRQGYTRETQLVLWKCHDRRIKGLEQEMFNLVKGNGAGYLVMGFAGSADKCIAARRSYNDVLVVRACDPFDTDQSWIFRRVDQHNEMYQMVQMSTGRCARAPGVDHDGAWVRVGDCDLSDERQLWQICGLDGRCDF